jgi:raffinose/stachyose/melibiose transport system permease protein
VLILVAVFWASPVLILVSTAVKTATDFDAHGATSLPGSLTFANFRAAWNVGQFGPSFVNSGLITLVKVPIGVFLAALMSYSLAKLKINLRRSILFLLLLGLTVPIFIAVVPVFTMLRQAGLIDSIWGLLPPYLAFGLPFEVLILTGFFKRIPQELIEAARIDGASELSIFVRVVLPLSLPVLITVAILDAVATWNELVMALVLLSSPGHRTVPLSLLNFQGQFTTDFPALCAGILIALLPILVAYGFLQRWIVSGLTAGAVKG